MSKVLHVAPFSPIAPSAGGTVRIAATAAALRERHRVLGIYFADSQSALHATHDPDVVLLTPSTEPRFRSRGSHARDRLLRLVQLAALAVRLPVVVPRPDPQLSTAAGALAVRPDVALVEFGQLAWFRPAGIPTVVVAHDLEWRKELLHAAATRNRGGLRARLEAARLRLVARELERSLAPAYAQHDAVVVMSEHDRDALRAAWLRLGIAEKPVFVVPNGVDVARFEAAGRRSAKPRTVTFAGGLQHPPNRDAVDRLVGSILPRVPQLDRLVLVGSGTDHVGGDRVDGRGVVDDVAAAYAEAVVTVAPIRWGSGTRIKILESLACGRPVIAFPEAAEGLDDLVASGGVVVVVDDESFARTVGELLEDPERARALGARGRAAVRVYDWSTVLARLEDAFAVVSDPQPSETADVEISIVAVGAEMIAACLRSLPAACTGLRWRATVVDNSLDHAVAALVERDFRHVRVHRNERPLGFGANHNQVLRRVVGTRDARYVLVLNDDTVLDPESVTALVALCDADDTIGCAGPAIRDPDGRPQASTFRFPSLAGELSAASILPEALHERLRSSVGGGDWLLGAALLLRTAAVAAVGGFDERFFLYSEETDLGLRLARAGFSSVLCPEARIVHVGGASTAGRTRLQGRSRWTYVRKHWPVVRQAALLGGLLVVYLWNCVYVAARIAISPRSARAKLALWRAHWTVRPMPDVRVSLRARGLEG